MKELVGQTSGFLPRDLLALVADAGANLFNSKESETEKMNSLSGDPVGDDVDQSSQLDKSNETLTPKADFTKALDRSKKRNASALGAPKVTIAQLFSVVFFFFILAFLFMRQLCIFVT